MPVFREKLKRARLAFVLVVGLVMCGQMKGLAQEKRFDFTMNQQTAAEVIEALKQLTNYRFLYNHEELENVVPQKKRFANASVGEILDVLLAGSNLSYTIEDNVIIISPKVARPAVRTAVARDTTIEGVVRDAGGTPLPGVTVLLKGTTMGVSTDAEGRFKLTLPALKGDIVLSFSFVGMQSQEVAYRKPADGKDWVVVMQEEDTELGEVVITGYSVTNRSKSPSAITSKKMEDLYIPGVTSLDKMLEGQIPDLMVMSNSGEAGVAPRIRIRGTSTLIGNREPLWVVDGVIVQDPVQISPDELNDPDYINRIGNAIAGINPQDIERIDVLKDASATALYGTKAANGVIVITTKRGHIGEPQISYRGTVTLKLRPRYSDRSVDLMNSSERMNISRELAEAGYQYASNVTMVGYEGLVQDLYNREITYEEFERQVDALKAENTDWFKLLTRDAVSTTNTLSVTGGTEKVRYYASVGVNVEEDVVKPNLDKRYTGTLNLDMNFTPWLAASFNVNANATRRKYYQEEIAPINYAYNTSRAIPAYTEDGDYSFYSREGSTGTPFDFNVLNELANSSQTQEGSSVTFRANVDVKPWDWLKVTGILSYAVTNTDIEGYWGERTFHVAQLRQSNYGGNMIDASQSTLPRGGELTEQNTRNKSYMFRLQADVNKYFGPDETHNITAFAGMEVNSTKYDSYQNVTRGYDPDRGKQFITFTVGEYPAYDNWMAANVPVITDNLTNMLSWYGSVSYSYGNWFTVNVNARYDGSNQFGERSNDNMLPIWSAALNYNVMEHFKDNQWVFDDLRLKLSYGYQGNMLDGQSPEVIIVKEPFDEHYDEYTSTISTYANPNLKWEKTGSFNLGLEFSMLSNRLMFSGSYYWKRTRDAYMTQEISDVNGMSSYVINGGKVTNSGYDISLTATIIRRENLRWHLSTTFSHTNNEVNSSPAADQYELTDFLNGTAVVEGQSVSSFYSYKFIGLDPTDGTPLFDDYEDRQEELYGLTNAEVYTRVLEDSGNREATIFGGLNTTVNWKNWRLNAAFSYSLGAKTRLFRLYQDVNGRIRPEDNLNRALLNRWQHPGDENHTDIPALLADGSSTSSLYHWSGYTSGLVPTIANTRWEMYNYGNNRVVSANYLKCTSLGLTYSFDAERWGFSLLEASFSVTNPFIWTAKDLKGQTPVQSGFTEVQLSERPTFTIGLNVTF